MWQCISSILEKWFHSKFNIFTGIWHIFRKSVFTLFRTNNSLQCALCIIRNGFPCITYTSMTLYMYKCATMINAQHVYLHQIYMDQENIGNYVNDKCNHWHPISVCISLDKRFRFTFFLLLWPRTLKQKSRSKSLSWFSLFHSACSSPFSVCSI